MPDPEDCEELYNSGINKSGVYTIYPHNSHSFDVFCNQTIAGGGWTVFQRKLDGSFSFDKTWKDYKNGFGDLSGEFWLGTKKLHRLAKHGTWQIRVDWEEWGDNNLPYVKIDVEVLCRENLKVKGHRGGDCKFII